MTTMNFTPVRGAIFPSTDAPGVVTLRNAVDAFRALRKAYLYRVMREQDGTITPAVVQYVEREDWK